MKHILLSTNCTQRINEIHYKELKLFKSLGYKVSVVAEQDKHKIISKKYIDNFINCKIKPQSINPFTNFFLIIKYFFIYKKIAPNIIIHSTIKPNIFGSIASSLLCIKSYSIVSGLGSTFHRKYFFNFFIKALYQLSQKRTKMVFFQNKNDLNYFVSNNFIKEKKAKIIPTGVELKKFDYKKYNILKNENQFKFLYAGRFQEEKGFFNFIEACKKMNQSYDNVFFHLLGDFPKNLNMSYYKKILNHKNFILHGYNNDIRDILINSDCVVMPSKREGMSNILLEAGAFKKPAITTNVPGCKEIISNHYNGLLIESSNVDLIFNAMKEMYKISSDKKVKMGQNALINIRKNFTYETVKQFYIKLLSH